MSMSDRNISAMVAELGGPADERPTTPSRRPAASGVSPTAKRVRQPEEAGPVGGDELSMAQLSQVESFWQLVKFLLMLAVASVFVRFVAIPVDQLRRCDL